jgi:hypothetical protein
LREAIRVRHYSIRTEEAYVQWVRRFIFFHNTRHPDEMGRAEVEAFLTHLAVEGQVAAATQNQALNAIVFLYKQVLKREVGQFENLVWAKRSPRVPVVLTLSEVKSVLERIDGVPGLMARILYGSGLRLMECCEFRVKDVGCLPPEHRQGALAAESRVPITLTWWPRSIYARFSRSARSCGRPTAFLFFLRFSMSMKSTLTPSRSTGTFDA